MLISVMFDDINDVVLPIEVIFKILKLSKFYSLEHNLAQMSGSTIIMRRKLFRKKSIRAALQETHFVFQVNDELRHDAFVTLVLSQFNRKDTADKYTILHDGKVWSHDEIAKVEGTLRVTIDIFEKIRF